MRVLDSMIGWLAPPNCISCGLEGIALCLLCKETEILPFGDKCWHCGELSKGASSCKIAYKNGSPRAVWVVSDYEGTSKKLIQAYKFNQHRSCALPIARLMAETLLEFNSDNDIKDKNYLLIPVPTATSRVRQRSFDHTALLSRELKFNLKMQTGAYLCRLGQSRQVGARRNVRLSQLESSFYVKNPETLKGRNILLIDDVITTGATICAATRALKSAGAKSVDALIFAKKL